MKVLGLEAFWDDASGRARWSSKPFNGCERPTTAYRSNQGVGRRVRLSERLPKGVWAILSLVVIVAHTGSAQTSIPFNHFIYIIQENHSFDSYFGTYPGANGIPPGTKLPESPNGIPKYKPFHLTATNVPLDLSHTWQAAWTAWNNGRMDGFVYAEWPQALQYYWGSKPVPTPIPGKVTIGTTHIVPASKPVLSPNGFADDEDEAAPDVEEKNATVPTAVAAAPSGSPPAWSLYTLGYMDYHEIPNYWEYARRFTLCDYFFSSLMGPSVPNHLYTLAADAGGLVLYP
jgi:phospholipase C